MSTDTRPARWVSGDSWATAHNVYLTTGGPFGCIADCRPAVTGDGFDWTVYGRGGTVVASGKTPDRKSAQRAVRKALRSKPSGLTPGGEP